MVIKYAIGEKDLLLLKKDKEIKDKKFIELNRERQLLSNKLKTVSDEKQKLWNNYDKKVILSKILFYYSL